MAIMQLSSIVKTQNFVAGHWVADGDGTLAVLHKYTGETMATLPLATPDQMETAIVAAHAQRKPFGVWSAGKRVKGRSPSQGAFRSGW